MTKRSRSTLFLMEQAVVVVVFAVCAAVCAAILADSYLLADRSNKISSALQVTESAAECFKAASGDTVQASEYLRGLGSSSGDESVYYDDNWQVCDASVASYALTFTSLGAETAASPILCKISVKETGGDEIISLTVSARGKTI